jgi:hypothetical protein
LSFTEWSNNEINATKTKTLREAMNFDPKELFDDVHVKFFDGPPDPEQIEPDQLGVNIDLFRQVKTHYRKAKENSACRILADICMDIHRDGYIGTLEESAMRVGTSWATVQRWRARFVEAGLIKQHSRNKLYSVDPKVAIRTSADGKILKPNTKSAGVFTF